MYRKIFNRIYADYFMPNRYPVYRQLLESALRAGYNHLTLAGFNRLIEKKLLDPSEKYFIHRHDIDSDAEGALEYSRIEKELNIKTSYYFRLSTVDIPIMQKIHATGSEVSYHFEEVATFCKRHRIHQSEVALKHVEEMKAAFSQNFSLLEKKCGFKFETVASHGDFVNRKLGLTNSVLIDESVRKEYGITAEAYDEKLLVRISDYISDKPAPVYFSPLDPMEAIKNNAKVICLLTHPRQWRTRIRINTIDNIQRLIEGIKYGNK